MNQAQWAEYDAAAEWCAKRSIDGSKGCRLPLLLDGNVVAEISANPEEFMARVRGFAYAQAMERAAIIGQKGYCT